MDEDATVEDEGPSASYEQPQQNVQSFHITEMIIPFITAYGWWFLLAAVVLVLLWPKISAFFRTNRPSRAARAQEDPEELFRRQEAMENARRKMQENMNHRVDRYLEEKEEKDRDKAKAKIEDWERHQQGLGYRSKTKVNDVDDSPATTQRLKTDPKKKKKFIPSDYNPLMGEGSGSTYRPARSNFSSGGG